VPEPQYSLLEAGNKLVEMTQSNGGFGRWPDSVLGENIGRFECSSMEGGVFLGPNCRSAFLEPVILHSSSSIPCKSCSRVQQKARFFRFSDEIAESMCEADVLFQERRQGKSGDRKASFLFGFVILFSQYWLHLPGVNTGRAQVQ